MSSRLAIARRLEAATAADLSALTGRVFPSSERWTPEAVADQILRPGAFALGVGDPVNGFVLGRTAAEEAEILILAVAPEARRGGLGRALMRAAMGEAFALGAADMFLEVAVENTPALALYMDLGFSVVGRRRGYYRNGDAFTLRAPLPR